MGVIKHKTSVRVQEGKSPTDFKSGHFRPVSLNTSSFTWALFPKTQRAILGGFTAANRRQNVSHESQQIVPTNIQVTQWLILYLDECLIQKSLTSDLHDLQTSTLTGCNSSRLGIKGVSMSNHKLLSGILTCSLCS